MGNHKGDLIVNETFYYTNGIFLGFHLNRSYTWADSYNDNFYLCSEIDFCFYVTTY